MPPAITPIPAAAVTPYSDSPTPCRNSNTASKRNWSRDLRRRFFQFVQFGSGRWQKGFHGMDLAR